MDDTCSTVCGWRDGKTYRTSHDWGEDDSISTTVATAISEATHREPMAFRPLDRAIDAEALDRLFSPSGDSLRLGGVVEFEFDGHEVMVHGNGKIVIEERDVDED